MSALVSVIVPVYNVESYLRRCLDSVLQQTLKDIEVVIVDDGSPDGSPTICDAYAELDARVKVIHKANAGLGYARNTGIEHASGRYFCFLDSDDYLEQNALQRLYELAERNDLDVVRAARNEFVVEGKFSHVVANTKLEVYEGDPLLRRITLCYFSQPAGAADHTLNLEGSAWGALYRSELFSGENAIRFVSERELVSEDFIFNYECALRSHRIGKIHDTLWHYRLNPCSLTKTPRKDCLQRSVDYSKYLEQRFSDDGFGGESRLYAMGYTVNTMRAHLKNMILSPMPRRELAAWLDVESRNPYYERIANEYPFSHMPFKHSIIFRLFYHRRFWMLKTLIRLRSRLSSILKPQL